MKQCFDFFAVVSMLIVISACASSGPGNDAQTRRGGGVDQIPMYGGIDRQSIPDLKEADDKLIADVTEEFGSRERASQAFVEQGIRYYQVDNYSLSMKRFNQAWLIDPNNPEVFWGFSLIYHDNGNYCKAREMVEDALERGLKNPVALADAGRLYTLCAARGAAINETTKEAYIAKSEDLYESAVSMAPGSDYVYGSWATAYYWRGDYENAWSMVAKQRKLGGTPGARFLNLLRSQMTEPN